VPLTLTLSRDGRGEKISGAGQVAKPVGVFAKTKEFHDCP